MAVSLAAIVAAWASQPADESTQSAHRPGPHGLEGWTLDWPVSGSGYGDERFAFTLVVARHGQILRRISGEPIIWSWIYWADGQDVAYETGPFHFALNCFLVRLSDGRKLESYDCYHDQPPAKPDWVKALEAAK